MPTLKIGILFLSTQKDVTMIIQTLLIFKINVGKTSQFLCYYFMFEAQQKYHK